MPMGLIQTKAFGTQECSESSNDSELLDHNVFNYYFFTIMVDYSTLMVAHKNMSMNVLTVETMNSKKTLALFHTA